MGEQDLFLLCGIYKLNLDLTTRCSLWAPLPCHGMHVRPEAGPGFFFVFFFFFFFFFFFLHLTHGQAGS